MVIERLLQSSLRNKSRSQRYPRIISGITNNEGNYDQCCSRETMLGLTQDIERHQCHCFMRLDRRFMQQATDMQKTCQSLINFI
jgi:hypothetical protein